jgi:hypothetical protein
LFYLDLHLWCLVVIIALVADIDAHYDLTGGIRGILNIIGGPKSSISHLHGPSLRISR